MIWWIYAVVFLVALAVDAIPMFGPPAWTIMVFLMLRFHLNPWLVLVWGVPGSTLGRYLFSIYVPKLSDKFMQRHKKEDLEFLGKKLSRRIWQSWVFVFLYTLTPLSTKVLFMAAAVAKVKPLHTVLPFLAGEFLRDALIILLGLYATANSRSFWEGLFSVKGILASVFGLLLLRGFIFIDWRALLQKRKFQLNFRVWK